MKVYINRILNLKKIKALGFDVDYTLVRYNTKVFEEFTYHAVKEKLVTVKKYPEKVLNLPFEYARAIQGLVIDKKHGNVLKLSRFGKVKQAYHGTHHMEFGEMQRIYQQQVIDLGSDDIQSLDTNFSIANGVLYAELVALKDLGAAIPSYETVAHDVKEMIDVIHRDGTLKTEVKNHLEKYIIVDPNLALLLERYKAYDKKLIIITNSDFSYCKTLLDYSITPYLKEYKDWQELFDVVVTFSMKPRFFIERNHFLKVDPETSLMSNYDGKVDTGILQGGNSYRLQKDLGLDGEEILYLGDHIYGDVVSIKKTCNWRTALVMEPLSEELESLKKANPIGQELSRLMVEKEKIEIEIISFYTKEHEQGRKLKREALNGLYQKVEEINHLMSEKVVQYQTHFNSYWGELMRAGLEESRFAGQLEKYACIYMEKITDLLQCSPRTYFRPSRRILPHEREFLS